MPSSSQRLTVLHYVGYNTDAGGIISSVRALAAADRFNCVLGVNRGFQQRRFPPLPTLEFSPLEGDRLNLATFWRARRVARAARLWLRADPHRRFHGHSRAGLAVALWLQHDLPRRTFVSVHCFGRQRWFYRFAERTLGSRLFWLTPEMRAYYDVAGQDWAQCIPSAITPAPAPLRRSRAAGDVMVFGGIGALVPLKGWHLILDAFARLSPSLRARARFSHIGGGDGTSASKQYETNLRSHELGGDKNFSTWLGEQPSSAGLLSEIDCLIVASENEALSLAMIEALNVGIPVLRADSGGGIEVIEAGRNGWLFRSGDAVDLAANLERILTTDDLMKTGPVPSAIERFSATRVAETWLEVYSRR